MNKNIYNSTLSTSQSNNKGAYVTPKIEQIVLDNEISLALESTPPIGPDEAYLNAIQEQNTLSETKVFKS